MIYRAYGGGSRRLGNCFFAPCVLGTLIGHWTAELLERELNAALWGNDFERVAVFRIRENVQYKIGQSAHDSYSGIDSGVAFYQRSFITPSGVFKQVSFFKEEAKPWTEYVKDMREDITIKPGNYAREASRRAKLLRQ